MQVLAREEPKRSGRKDNTKRDEWKRDVDEARQWLRDRDIEPAEAARIWWRQSDSKLQTDRKYENRRRVQRQLGAAIKP